MMEAKRQINKRITWYYIGTLHSEVKKHNSSHNEQAEKTRGPKSHRNRTSKVITSELQQLINESISKRLLN